MGLYMNMQKCLKRRVDTHCAVRVNTHIIHIQVRSPAGNHLPGVENNTIEYSSSPTDARGVDFSDQSK